jgi:hypothetical protein
MKRHTFDHVDLELPGGRLLRVGLHRTPDVDAEPVVTLALVWDSDTWSMADGLRLPAGCVPDLTLALAALLEAAA